MMESWFHRTARPYLLSLLAVVCLVVTSVQPVSADDDTWYCDQCSYTTPGGPFMSCNYVRTNAVVGCCAATGGGTGGGDAMCLDDGLNPHYNPGFWAYCWANSKQCDCDKYGDFCQRWDEEQ